MKILLNYLELKSINSNDKKQIAFFNEILKQNKWITKTDIEKINIDDVYLVYDNELCVGYFCMSSPIITGSGLAQINLSYGISEKYKNQNYEIMLIKDISDILLKDKQTMLVLNVDKNDLITQKVATESDFNLEYTDEDNMVYTKYAKALKRHQ